MTYVNISINKSSSMYMYIYSIYMYIWSRDHVLLKVTRHTSCSIVFLFRASQLFWIAIILFSRVTFLSSSSSSSSSILFSITVLGLSPSLVCTPQDIVSLLCFRREGRLWSNRINKPTENTRGEE